MARQHHRICRVLATTVAAATLVAPATASLQDDGGSIETSSPASSSSILRNDIAHHGTQSSPNVSNAILRNDVAHFGNRRAVLAQGSSAPVVVRVNEGFDWFAAGAGAAGGFGLLLVAGVTASALRRRHSSDPARGMSAAPTSPFTPEKRTPRCSSPIPRSAASSSASTTSSSSRTGGRLPRPAQCRSSCEATTGASG